MFSTLRTRFGIPGVISVIALVFAMFGGAYAASNSGSGGGKATASAKAKKGPRGPKGATGPAGPAGSQGPAGANGKDGLNGTNGSNGAAGSAGANGKSVAVATLPPGQGGCTEGGVSVEVAGESATKKPVCNGEPGTQGDPGSPWTAGGTLPANATETGTYALYGPGIQGEGVELKYPVGVKAVTSVSFPVPLASALDENHVVFVPTPGSNPDPTHCTGSVPDPEAAGGYMCIYAGNELNASFQFALLPDGMGIGASAGGTVLSFANLSQEAAFYAIGSWAVTG